MRADIGIERTLLYCARRDDVRDGGGPLPRGSRLELLRLAQLPRLADIGPVTIAECNERLARGDLCHAVWHGDELIHYSWVQRAGVHPIDAAGLELPVRAGELWIYNCRTSERWRGLGIYPAVLARILEEQLAAGIERAWIYTSSTNQASQRGIARAGFRPAGMVKALRLGPWCYRLARELPAW